MMDKFTEDDINHLFERLVRIESRLVQLMLHLGLDPQSRQRNYNQEE